MTEHVPGGPIWHHNCVWQLRVPRRLIKWVRLIEGVYNVIYIATTLSIAHDAVHVWVTKQLMPWGSHAAYF